MYYPSIGEVKMNYISIVEAAEIWGISRRRVQILCLQGRIPGVEKLGKSWAIPRYAKKPKDARVKSGKYIKNPQQRLTNGANNYE